MAGPTRWIALGLLACIGGSRATTARADDEPTKPAQRALPPAFLEDTPAPFVPLHPRTVEDRRWLESVEAYAAARSLEDRRLLLDAINLLEPALKEQPDSVAILRRLSLLCFALGRIEQAVSYSRQVIDADPNDTETLHRLVRYYEIRNDPEGAEALLTKLLANPKLDTNAPSYLLAQHDIGMFYHDRLLRMSQTDKDYQPALQKAADAFASLLVALDDKAANKLSLADLRHVLGLGPEAADSYLIFGTVLLDAKRNDFAVRAFERGLVYKPDDPQLVHMVSRALLAAGKNAEALEHAEQFARMQPQQREAYDMLAQSLIALKREKEIVPRLEAAAQADPRNRAIQYVLAERYGQIGQRAKANAIFEQIRANPPTAQDFAALSAWLLKERKTDELIKLLGEASGKRDGLEAVRPQIETIASDPRYASEVLDAALKLMQADPPALSKDSRRVVAYIASRVNKTEQLTAILRLAVQKDPTPQDYHDLADTLKLQGKFDEVADTIEELLKKYPSNDPKNLLELGRNRLRAQKKEAALEAFRAAQKLDPNDPGVLYYLCVGLGSAGKDDEAVELARDVLKRDPSNDDFNRLLGSLLIQSGRETDAAAHYKSMLERFPTNDELEKLAHSGLSVIYVNKDDFTHAEAELEIVYKKFPDDAGVNNDLGYLYADQGKKLDQAERMVRKALNEEPENYAYRDSLGWVLFKKGKVKEALGPITKAAADPLGLADPTIQDHLGDVYFRLHEYAKARTAWDQAAKLAAETRPVDKRLPEIRKKLESLKELEPAPRTSTGNNP
jgi:tetratricopeptide (TPR) repeat protein